MENNQNHPLENATNTLLFGNLKTEEQKQSHAYVKSNWDELKKLIKESTLMRILESGKNTDHSQYKDLPVYPLKELFQKHAHHQVIKKYMEDAQKLQYNIETLESKLHTLQNEVTISKSEKNDLNLKIIEVEKLLKEEKNYLTNEKQHHVQKIQQIENLTNDVNAKTKQIQDLNNILSQNKQKIENLTNDVNAKTTKIQDLNKSVSEKEQKIEELKKDLDTKKQTIQDLNNNANEKTNQIKEMQKDLDTKKQSIQDLNNNANEKTTQIKELQKDLDTNKQTIQDLTNDVNAKTTQIKELNKSVSEKEQTIEELKNSVSEKEQKIEELENNANIKTKEIENLTNDVNEKTKQIKEIQNNLDTKKQQIQDLQNNLDTNKQKIEELENNLLEKELLHNKQMKEFSIGYSELEYKLNLEKKDHLELQIQHADVLQKIFNIQEVLINLLKKNSKNTQLMHSINSDPALQVALFGKNHTTINILNEDQKEIVKNASQYKEDKEKQLQELEILIENREKFENDIKEIYKQQELDIIKELKEKTNYLDEIVKLKIDVNNKIIETLHDLKKKQVI